MASFDRPHISLEGRRVVRHYQDRERPIGPPKISRTRAEHGAWIRNQFNAALAETQQALPANDSLPPSTGTYVEVELVPGKHPEKTIDRTSKGIRSGAVIQEPNEFEKVVLFVPENAQDYLR